MMVKNMIYQILSNTISNSQDFIPHRDIKRKKGERKSEAEQYSCDGN